MGQITGRWDDKFDAWLADEMGFPAPAPVNDQAINDQAVACLESASIQWRRDWDALALGFVLGVLSTLATQAVW